MAVNTTSILDDSLRAQYIEDYEVGAYYKRLYDQIAMPVAKSKDILQRGSSVVIPFLNRMNIGTTAISETVDVTPQTLTDQTTSITPTSRGEAIQDSEQLLLQAYTNYGSQRFKVVGENMMESVDVLARDQATQGSLVIRGAARASLDAGTAGHLLTEAKMAQASTMLLNLKSPQFGPLTGFETGTGASWVAIMSPEMFYALRTGGNVVSIAQYQKANIILNEELGQIGRFRLVVSPWAKIFGSAGLDNGSNAATTLNGAVSKGATTAIVSSATNISVGQYLTIGTEETGNTHQPENERVRYVSGTTTITFVGEGEGGGLRFDHASGVAVRNADSVHTVVYAGPQSLAKIYAVDVGEFGKVVGPKRQGLIEQWVSIGWKWWGAYGVISQNRMVRGEYASTLDA